MLVIILLAASVTATSLWYTLREQTNAAALEHRRSETFSTVLKGAHNIDSILQTVERGVASLAAATSEIVSHAPESPHPRWTPEELSDATNSIALTEHKAYHQQVTFEVPVDFVPSDADPEAIAHFRNTLGHLNPYLEQPLLDSLPESIQKQSREHQLDYLRSQAAPVLNTFTGFENGLMVTYPGLAQSDIDPRTRPWYKSTLTDPDVGWRTTYPQAKSQSLLIPCTAGITSDDGRIIGVVGADFAIQSLIDLMDFSSLPGFQRAVILDEHGQILVDTNKPALRSPMTSNSNRAIQLRPFHVATIVDAARAGRNGGMVKHERQTMVFSRLRAVGWTLVSIFETHQFQTGPLPDTQTTSPPS